MTVCPNLFIVGAPRSGTTSMYNYLQSHPQVAMCAKKEPHHFCDDLIDPDFVLDEGDYLNLFSHVRDQPFVGEASVWYLYSGIAAQRIRKFNPDARLIAILRSPVDMLASLHRHHVYTGFESHEDFESAYRLPTPILPADDESFRRHLNYQRVARYGEQMERVFECFPRDQVHVALFDDLQSDPAKTYRAVIDFLSLRPSIEPEFIRHNIRRRVRNRLFGRVNWRLKRLTAAAPPARTRFGTIARRTQRGITRTLSRLNSVAIGATALPASLRGDIISDHADDIRKLSDLIGRDLKAWLQC